MLTINPERGLKLKFQKDAFMFWSRVCRFYFETDKVLGADFVRCDMNNVTIPYALCIEKKHCVLRHHFQRGVIWIQKTTV